MKKKVLFVIHRLSQGGSQHSLIQALNHINYDLYDVDLFVQENKIDLVPEINKNVRIIVDETPLKKFNKKIFPRIVGVLCSVTGKLKMRSVSEKLAYFNKDRVYGKKNENAYKTYFSDDPHYDAAISFVQYQTASFVADYVNADYKYVFYRTSVDDDHKIHERVFPKFDLIVGVSVQVSEMLKCNYKSVSDRIICIENAVDYSSVIEKSEADIEFDDKHSLKICTCGRLSEEKGFDLAVEAAKELKSKDVDFIWYFVGDGSNRVKIEELIGNNNLSENISIVGFVNNPYPYMKHCDIYVQPSWNEAYGLCINEAKMLCRPVVSTKTLGGNNQIRDGENGVLCDFTGESISDGIMRIYSDETLKIRIINTLKAVDYEELERKYVTGWDKLLRNDF